MEKMLNEAGISGAVVVEAYLVFYESTSWYTFEIGETQENIAQKMETRYPSHAGYSFERVWNIPVWEEIIPPPATPIRA